MALPWTEVNAIAARDVAELLGLTPVNSARRNYNCPVDGCGSSDALRFYPRQNWFYCFSHGTKELKNVDLAAAVWGVPPAAACEQLARQFGIVWIDATPVEATIPVGTWDRLPRKRLTQQEENLAALAALTEPVEPHQVYARLHQRLSLSAAAADYLDRRGLDAALCGDYGFRSIDRPEDWQAILDVLEALRPEERAAAGFPTVQGRIKLPLAGRAPLVLIPFWKDGTLVGLRFRNLDPRAGQKFEDPRTGKSRRLPKYLSLPDATPLWPFMADGLRARTVHVIEGEFNAWSIMLPTYRMRDSAAVGIQGAAVWRPLWTMALRAAEHVVLWYDDDPAGNRAVEAHRAQFAAEHGEDWVRRRLRRMLLPIDHNALHQAGQLRSLIVRAPWHSAAASMPETESLCTP